MKAIILAAGIGSRLGKSHPKPLTLLANGETILSRQIDILSKYLGEKNIILVVGFKKELIIEKFPEITFVENNMYKNTNTAKSLLLGMENLNSEDIIWLNGDVFFDKKIIQIIMKFNGSGMAVNTNNVSDEEIKYSINKEGYIDKVSKKNDEALGEAVGINKINRKYINLLRNSLKECNNNDYFERGLELSIKQGLKLSPININQYFCMEIDYQSDYKAVNSYLESKVKYES